MYHGEACWALEATALEVALVRRPLEVVRLLSRALQDPLMELSQLVNLQAPPTEQEPEEGVRRRRQRVLLRGRVLVLVPRFLLPFRALRPEWETLPAALDSRARWLHTLLAPRRMMAELQAILIEQPLRRGSSGLLTRAGKGGSLGSQSAVNPDLLAIIQVGRLICRAALPSLSSSMVTGRSADRSLTIACG